MHQPEWDAKMPSTDQEALAIRSLRDQRDPWCPSKQHLSIEQEDTVPNSNPWRPGWQSLAAYL